jgi:hypothetical protein
MSEIVQAIAYQDGFVKSTSSSRRFIVLFLSEIVGSSEPFLFLNALDRARPTVLITAVV